MYSYTCNLPTGDAWGGLIRIISRPENNKCNKPRNIICNPIKYYPLRVNRFIAIERNITTDSEGKIPLKQLGKTVASLPCRRR